MKKILYLFVLITSSVWSNNPNLPETFLTEHSLTEIKDIDFSIITQQSTETTSTDSSTTENNCPTINTDFPVLETPVDSGGITIPLDAIYSDSDGDVLTYEIGALYFNSGPSSVEGASISLANGVVTLNTGEAFLDWTSGDVFKFMTYATDGKTCNQPIQFEVVVALVSPENNCPTVNENFPVLETPVDSGGISVPL
ncbi:MAG: hypothetical protein CMC21_00375, partial [Flavobacteriaceae bacterium]|nr:hypothetical protein [Flavobacteriaceae bacterium]